MARRLRIFEPGAYYHVAARGNNGEPIVRDDFDRLDFLRWLSRIVFENRWRVVTYCLMTNHYHLLMRATEVGFATGMQLLNCGHARRMNRKHGRTGHLFRNHYSWWPIESDEHLHEAVRYIVLNQSEPESAPTRNSGRGAVTGPPSISSTRRISWRWAISSASSGRTRRGRGWPFGTLSPQATSRCRTPGRGTP